MKRTITKKKYTCLMFGEGKRDKDFLRKLIDLDKFKYHTSKWAINYGNASGGSAKIILDKCRKAITDYSYDLALCFVDVDELKYDFPRTWKKEQAQLEAQHADIKIIWQLDNAEDEYKKVLGDKPKGKHSINKTAKEEIKKFINSDFWNKILEPIRQKEKELD